MRTPETVRQTLERRMVRTLGFGRATCKEKDCEERPVRYSSRSEEHDAQYLRGGSRAR